MTNEAVMQLWVCALQIECGCREAVQTLARRVGVKSMDSVFRPAVCSPASNSVPASGGREHPAKVNTQT